MFWKLLQIIISKLVFALTKSVMRLHKCQRSRSFFDLDKGYSGFKSKSCFSQELSGHLKLNLFENSGCNETKKNL